MTNPLYTRLQGTADRMLARFGAAATIIAPGQPDEVNGGDPVAVSYPCQAVIAAYDQRYVNGTSILAGDVQIIISAVGLGVEPKVGMRVSAGGKSYLIVNIDLNRFDGATPVVYVAQGRT